MIRIVLFMTPFSAVVDRPNVTFVVPSVLVLVIPVLQLYVRTMVFTGKKHTPVM